MAKARQPKSMEEALEWLRDGNENYVDDCMDRPLQNAARRKETASEQHPWAIVLTCADSRVTPELVFDCGIGELFVVRVAGNIANACSIASIDYAVKALGVKLIVVLGHENCGAVKASLAGDSVSYNVDQLLGHLTPISAEFGPKWAKAKGAKQDKIQNEAAAQNAENVANSLKEQSTVIWNAEELTIKPALYSTATGKVEWGPWWT